MSLFIILPAPLALCRRQQPLFLPAPKTLKKYIITVSTNNNKIAGQVHVIERNIRVSSDYVTIKPLGYRRYELFTSIPTHPLTPPAPAPPLGGYTVVMCCYMILVVTSPVVGTLLFVIIHYFYYLSRHDSSSSDNSLLLTVIWCWRVQVCSWRTLMLCWAELCSDNTFVLVITQYCNTELNKAV